MRAPSGPADSRLGLSPWTHRRRETGPPEGPRSPFGLVSLSGGGSLPPSPADAVSGVSGPLARRDLQSLDFPVLISLPEGHLQLAAYLPPQLPPQAEELVRQE